MSLTAKNKLKASSSSSLSSLSSGASSSNFIVPRRVIRVKKPTVFRFLISFLVFLFLYVSYSYTNLSEYITTSSELHHNGEIIPAENQIAYRQSFGLFDKIPSIQWETIRQEVKLYRDYYLSQLQFHQSSHHVTAISGDASRWYMTNPPQKEFNCPNEGRIKSIEEHERPLPGSASRWVCAPDRIIPGQVRYRQDQVQTSKSSNSETLQNKRCLVYALYASMKQFDGTFENGVRDTIGPECEVHVFVPDDFSDVIVPPSSSSQQHVTLHQWGLKGSNVPMSPASRYLDFERTVSVLGHQYETIDLFYVDCEGCEWFTFRDWLEADVVITQIVLRTRTGAGVVTGGETDGGHNHPPMGFFDAMRRENYVIFHKEETRRSLEYSFLKLEHSFFLAQEREQKQEHSLQWLPMNFATPGDVWKTPSITHHRPALPNCCNHPFAQQRTPQTSKRFSKVCIDMKEEHIPLLRYAGPGAYTSAALPQQDLIASLHATGGDLVLLGDSTTRQWFEQLACYLGSFEIWRGFARRPIAENRGVLESEITRLMSGMSESVKRRGHMGVLNGQEDSSFGSFYLAGADKVGRRVIYQGLNNVEVSFILELISFYNQVYPKEFRLEPPLIVINIGLHYNDDESNGRDRLKQDLTALVAHCVALDARCIFRESQPQHFDTAQRDGLFQLNAKKKCMDSPPPFFWTLNRWRVTVLHSVIKQLLDEMAESESTAPPKRGFIKIMPLFDYLAFLTHAHGLAGNGTPDCTHFLMNPEFWEPWHISLLNVLKEVL